MSDQSFKRETVTGAFSSLARLSSASEGRCRLNIVVPSLMPTIDPWEARSRTYRSAFRSTSPQRGGLLNSPDSPTFQRSEAMVLGPGSYEVIPDVNCGGIRHEERPGPSRMFVPRVGGKFAMVGGGF